jgi:hypothetical protein
MTWISWCTIALTITNAAIVRQSFTITRGARDLVRQIQILQAQGQAQLLDQTGPPLYFCRRCGFPITEDQLAQVVPQGRVHFKDCCTECGAECGPIGRGPQHVASCSRKGRS